MSAHMTIDELHDEVLALARIALRSDSDSDKTADLFADRAADLTMNTDTMTALKLCISLATQLEAARRVMSALPAGVKRFPIKVQN